MPDNAAINLDIADLFSNALVRGDVDGVLDCYAPRAELWHNFDDLTVDPHASRESLEAFFVGFPEREITKIRRHAIEGGMVQQHVLHLTRADGRKFIQPICIVFTISAGKIDRLEEYVDLARMA